MCHARRPRVRPSGDTLCASDASVSALMIFCVLALSACHAPVNSAMVWNMRTSKETLGTLHADGESRKIVTWP